MLGCGSPLAPQKNVATPPTRTPWFVGLRIISGGCDASAHCGIRARNRTLAMAVSNAAHEAACSPMSQFPRALIILLLPCFPLTLDRLVRFGVFCLLMYECKCVCVSILCYRGKFFLCTFLISHEGSLAVTLTLFQHTFPQYFAEGLCLLISWMLQSTNVW